MRIQEHYLNEISHVALTHSIPVICAGDIFDRWNPPAELIHFALRHLPLNMICVPGQHDLPSHNLEDVDRSGYGVLVEAGKIHDISGSVTHQPGFSAYGAAWGQTLPKPEQTRTGIVKVGLVHRYCWVVSCSYPGAPESNKVTAFKKELEGYDVTVFGDNHIPFCVFCGRGVVFNCGGFTIRKSDEIGRNPGYGLLFPNGVVDRVIFDTSIDKFHPDAEKREEVPADMRALIKELKKLGEHGMDFREAVVQQMDRDETDPATRQIVLSAMEPKDE